MQEITGDKLFFSILDSKRQILLNKICESGLVDKFYLAGGTALSLQMNLRQSFDFDFFSSKPFNEDLMLNSLSVLFPDKVKALQISRGTCDLIIDDVQVSFFQYPYQTISPIVSSADIPKLKLASIYDIAVMKLSAIGSRGSKKDFFDLYQIYQRVSGYNSIKLISDTKQKFGSARDLSYMFMSLSYFDDAENEILPTCFIDYDWETIKKFFRNEQAIIEKLL